MKKISFTFRAIFVSLGIIGLMGVLPYPDNLSPLQDTVVSIVGMSLFFLLWYVLVFKTKIKSKLH